MSAGKRCRGRRGRARWERPDRQRLKQKLLVSGGALDRAVLLAKEKSGAHRLERVRLQDERYLPRLGKKAAVDLLVGIGEKDLAARVRVVPAYRERLSSFLSRGNEVRRAWRWSRGERTNDGPKACSQSSRTESRIVTRPFSCRPSRMSADLGSASRKGKERVGHGQPDIVQHPGRVFDGKGHSGVVHIAKSFSEWISMALGGSVTIVSCGGAAEPAL